MLRLNVYGDGLLKPEVNGQVGKTIEICLKNRKPKK
jgi:hypothetical protein